MTPTLPAKAQPDQMHYGVKIYPFLFRQNCRLVPDPDMEIAVAFMHSPRRATIVYRLPGEPWQINHKIPAWSTLQFADSHLLGRSHTYRRYWLDLQPILPGYELICLEDRSKGLRP